jgi:hypothetical protein
VLFLCVLNSLVRDWTLLQEKTERVNNTAIQIRQCNDWNFSHGKDAWQVFVVVYAGKLLVVVVCVNEIARKSCRPLADDPA